MNNRSTNSCYSATNDDSEIVRLAAIERLKNQKTLLEIIEKETNQSILAKATEVINDWNVRLIAIE